MKFGFKREVRALAAFFLLVPLLLSLQSRPVIAQAGNPLLVVINPANQAGAKLSRGDLKNILLGNTTNWQSGEQIPVILGPPGDIDRTAVLKEVGGINESVFTRRQLQASFAGGTPVVIREVRSGAEVKAALKSSPFAVGFLHKNQVDDSVKVVLTLD